MELGGMLEVGALVLTAVLSIVGTVFNDKYKAMKGLIKTIGEAIEDDKLTKEEVQAIYKQIKKLF